MAKKNLSLVFEHAVIDMNDRTLTEFNKDGESVYDIDEILRDWAGVEELSITIKKTGVVSPNGGGAD